MNILIVLIKIIIGLLMMLGAAAYFTLYERRLIGKIQDRIGPNRVGWNGILQPIANAFKLILKEDIVPTKADPLIHSLAPTLAVFFSMAAVVIIPFGDKWTIAGYDIRWSFPTPEFCIFSRQARWRFTRSSLPDGEAGASTRF